MAHLDNIVIDSEYGFLESLVRWIDKRAVIQFGKSGDEEYRCLMTYRGKSYETTSKTLFDALKIAAGKHSSDTIYGGTK